MVFQTQVNAQPALAVEGDFASANPRASMIAGEGALIAGAAGVLVGRFARARNSNNTVTNADPGFPSRLGFVHRDQFALITAWLGEATMAVPAGIEVALMDGGDFFARFAGGGAIGQKVFASYADGSCVAAAAGATVAGANVDADTTTGSKVVTVNVVNSGVLAVGQPISGTGIPAGAYIESFGTSTGGVGTINISANATATTTTDVVLTTSGAEETPFYLHSTTGAGELGKISNRPAV